MAPLAAVQVPEQLTALTALTNLDLNNNKIKVSLPGCAAASATLACHCGRQLKHVDTQGSLPGPTNEGHMAPPNCTIDAIHKVIRNILILTCLLLVLSHVHPHQSPLLTPAHRARCRTSRCTWHA